ncbi:unnamed protein product [Rodentolepis nana]|uniref:DEP domain-containing protein n=1 Tax=Rodentolepis nana TaxID=102285 RepID=A0A0R3TKQ8_RODNA|nr:unnamed protein product [Rodentolepis nana]
MSGSSSIYKASSALKSILFQWKCEVSDPFPLSEAKIWLRRYFIAHYGDTHKVGDFLSFLLQHKYVKVVCYEKSDCPLYFLDDASLTKSENACDVNLKSNVAITDQLQIGIFYRSLAISLIDRIISSLPHRIRGELHPFLHYNSHVVRQIAKFPSLDSCKYCFEWLATCGKNVYNNSFGFGHNVDVDLIAQLDYLAKCSKSRALPKDNRLVLLSSLIESSLQILKGFGDISPPHQMTLRLVDFLLRYHEKVKSKGDAFSSEVLTVNRVRHSSSPMNSPLKSHGQTVSRSSSVSPKPFQRSKTLIDLNFNSANRRGVSLLPGRLVKSRSAVFNSIEMIEQTLRLASILLPPKICYTIAYFSSALINIYFCVGGDVSTQDFYPLCNPEYLSSSVTSVLFTKTSERTEMNTGSNIMESLLLILFSSRAQDVYPPKLLQDLIDLSNPPSSLKKIKENIEVDKQVNEVKSPIPLKSAMSHLNIQSPSLSSSSSKPLKAIHSESTPKMSTGDNNKNVTSSIDLISELATKKGLMNLLNSILVDQSIDLKTKYGYLTQFRQNHSEIFLKRFTNQETADAYMDRMLRKVNENSKNQSSMNSTSRLSKAINKLPWSKTTPKSTK